MLSGHVEADRHGLYASRQKTRWFSSKVARSKRQQQRRAALLDRDGDLCHVCHLPFTDNRPPTIDHFIERSKGGNSKLNNLKLAHESCNNMRSNKPERATELRPYWIRQQYGIVPLQFRGDRRPTQPVRILDYELAPALPRRTDLRWVSEQEGWFFGKYA
jgi:hypothetical protein